MEPGKRAREEEDDSEEAAAAPSSSSNSSSSSSSAAPPFRGPAADSALGERLLDVIGVVSAVGFACEVSHCLFLCGETWRKGDKGATNDMLVRSLERQCGARAARAARRQDFRLRLDEERDCEAPRSTQLIRAALLNHLPRVLQLVQLGAPLGLADASGCSALQWACDLGHEHVAAALLDGKYDMSPEELSAAAAPPAPPAPHARADVDAGLGGGADCTPLASASRGGSEGVARLLLARGARQALQDSSGMCALHWAVFGDHAGVVALLCAAPGAAAALALRDGRGRTPHAAALFYGRAECEALLRAHGGARLAAEGEEEEEEEGERQARARARPTPRTTRRRVTHTCRRATTRTTRRRTTTAATTRVGTRAAPAATRRRRRRRAARRRRESGGDLGARCIIFSSDPLFTDRRRGRPSASKRKRSAGTRSSPASAIISQCPLCAARSARWHFRLQ